MRRLFVALMIVPGIAGFVFVSSNPASAESRSGAGASYTPPPLVPKDQARAHAAEANADIESNFAAPEIIEAEGADHGADDADFEEEPLHTIEAEPPRVYEDEIQRRLDEDRIELDMFYRVLQDGMDVERAPMSLMECVMIALDNNEDILITAYEPQKSGADVFAAHGEFDPNLSGDALYLRSTQETPPDVATFSGITETEVHRTTSSVGLSGMLHWGTTYNVSVNLDKEQTTFTQFQKEWSGGVNLSVSQPLLRGRGKGVNLARIRIAENARSMAEEQLMVTVMNTVAEVIRAYWDVAAAMETVRVREESVANAERLYEINQKRLEIGTAASIDVLQAEAGVAQRQGDLVSARSALRDAEDRLKQLLNLREGALLSRIGILPVDEPDVFEPELNEEESVALALDNRPEVRSAELETATSALEVRTARDDLQPRVDVSGSLFQGGRDDQWDGVFSGVVDRSDHSYTVGVSGSVPIGNRAARGSYQRARLSRRQAEDRLQQTKHELMLNVRLAMRAVETARALVESSRRARRLQETNVDAEERRLELGVTTSYQVLQVQEDLTNAQVQEVQALVNFEQALTDLRLAEGILLRELGVEFDAPDAEPPASYWHSVLPRPMSVD